MNVAKSIEVKEQIDTVQVSIDDVNRCLNNVQFESSMIRSYARDSLNKIEGVEEKLVDHLDASKQLITGLTGKVEKLNLSKTEKPVPKSFLVKKNIRIQDPIKSVDKFSALFTKEVATSLDSEATNKITIASLFKDKESDTGKEQKHQDTQIFPIYKHFEHSLTRYPTPDIEGKGKLPEVHTFFAYSHREWNIDIMSVGQIRQMIDMMYTEYKLMCLRGKSEIDACRTIIQCFTRTLLRWWETESSPKLIETMEAEVLKDEKGDVIHNSDGLVISNMIRALTSMILEHWCGSEIEIADKNEVILMNLKCHKMPQYEDFQRD